MSSRTSACFEIRNSTFDTLLFVVKTADLNLLRKELTRRFEDKPAFFAHDVVVVDVCAVDAGQTVQIDAVAAILRQIRMHPIGVVARAAQREWAAQTSLPLIESCDWRAARAEAAAGEAAGKANKDTQAPLHKTATEHLIEAQKPALIIDKPLRSGQQIYAAGDLVVLGLVNHGAEIIAEGHIHVYAPLRGRALAGVRGDHSARIFCTCLEPELLSIAGIYRTAEAPLPDSLQRKPVQVRLVEEQLIIEPLRLD